MTRQGYEMIAAVVRTAEMPAEARKALAKRFASELASTNERFDRERFERACDPTESYPARSHGTDKTAFRTVA
jgi:hypothetical protein